MAGFNNDYNINLPTARNLPADMDDMIRVDIKSALHERYALEHIALNDADVDETSSTCAGRHIAGGCTVCLIDTWYNIMRVVPTCSNTIAYATDSKQFFSYNVTAAEWQWLNILTDSVTAWNYAGVKSYTPAISVGVAGLTDSEKVSQTFTTTDKAYYILAINEYSAPSMFAIYNHKTVRAWIKYSVYLDDVLVDEYVPFDNQQEYPTIHTPVNNEFHGSIGTTGSHTLKVLVNATFEGINTTSFSLAPWFSLGIFSDGSFTWS